MDTSPQYLIRRRLKVYGGYSTERGSEEKERDSGDTGLIDGVAKEAFRLWRLLE